MHRLHPDPTPEERSYWRRNVRIVLSLLVVWFAVSYGAGILFVEQLNAVRLPGTGFPLGFWFAQQGAIYVFVLLIFVYVLLLNRLDREFEESQFTGGEGGSGPASAGGERPGPAPEDGPAGGSEVSR